MKTHPTLHAASAVRTPVPPLSVEIVLAEESAPEGRLADAALHFHSGPCAGLTLRGFVLWRRADGGVNVTVPVRAERLRVDRRGYRLLLPICHGAELYDVEALILREYRRVSAPLHAAGRNRRL